MAVKQPLPETGAGEGVTTPLGFSAGVASADVRGDQVSRADVMVLVSDRPAAVAGVFTQNRVKAAPVVLSQLHLRGGTARAVVVNSGNANACTGARGLADALRMAQATADQVDCVPGEVLVASTGVIGRLLPIERILPAISRAYQARSTAGGAGAARSIMTTDTRPKQAERSFECSGTTYRLGGMAKGSGMIHPDMATLLAFVTTDAPVGADLLQAALRDNLRCSFNAISVDGDTSTNDCCLALANGAAGGENFPVGSEPAARFHAVMGDLMADLAEQVVADGEGATRTFSVSVDGAATQEEAWAAARAVSSSALVKTAVHGRDPNWGRVLAVLGRCGAEVVLDRCRLSIQGEELFGQGQVRAVDLDRLGRLMGEDRVAIEVELGLGDGSARAVGCDLSPEYVRINAEYTT